MGKKQRERKQKKLASRPGGVTSPPWFGQDISPEAQRAIEKASNANLLRDEEVLVKVLSESGKWRNEPELRDWHFDTKQVANAVNRLLPKYEPLLDRAKKASQAEFHTTYDDLRIEAIDQVLTREQRQDFLKRFDALLKRLMQGRDSQNIEQALFFRTLLGQKDFPWGITALVTTLFEEAKAETLKRYNQAEDVMVEVLKQEHPDASEQELREMIQDQSRRNELPDLTKIPPALMEKMTEITDEMFHDFESALFAGEFDLALFTPEELEQVAGRINQFVSAARPSPTAELSAPALAQLVQLITDYLEQIMTEPRLHQIERDLGTIQRDWGAARQLEAELLRIERDNLRDLKPSENRFLYAALLGQIRRAEKEAEEQEDEVSDEQQPILEAGTTPARQIFRNPAASIKKK